MGSRLDCLEPSSSYEETHPNGSEFFGLRGVCVIPTEMGITFPAFPFLRSFIARLFLGQSCVLCVANRARIAS